MSFEQEGDLRCNSTVCLRVSSLNRNKKPQGSCIPVMAFMLLGDDEWTSKYFHPQSWLRVYATWAGEPGFLHREIQSIQYHSLSRGREWSSTYTEVLLCLGWNEQWNHHHLSRQVEGQWGLTEELLATEVKEWAVTLKHFCLPHAWHRKKHDYKQNVLTLYCQKPIFCYSYSDRITCRLLSVEELKMGKSLIKHKVMCIFPLQFKNTKMPKKYQEILWQGLSNLCNWSVFIILNSFAVYTFIKLKLFYFICVNIFSLFTNIGKIIPVSPLSVMFSCKIWLLAGAKREFSSAVWVAGPICRAAADTSENRTRVWLWRPWFSFWHYYCSASLVYLPSHMSLFPQL